MTGADGTSAAIAKVIEEWRFRATKLRETAQEEIAMAAKMEEMAWELEIEMQSRDDE